MKPTFQADADLNEDIVSAVLRREPSIDFQTANAAKLRDYPDPKVLAVAASEGRILVSHDRKTMPRHFGEFILKEQSPGLLIVSQDLPIAEAAEELILIWATSEAEEWINCICNIPL